MRRSARRPPGSLDQATSWPCALATVRRAPAARSALARMPSGAAAPNQTASIRSSRTSSIALARTDGSGSIHPPGWR